MTPLVYQQPTRCKVCFFRNAGASLAIHALLLVLIMHLSGVTIPRVATGRKPKRTAVALLFPTRPAPAPRPAGSPPRARPNSARPNLVRAMEAPPAEAMFAPPPTPKLPAVPPKWTLPRLDFEPPPRPASDSNGFAGVAVSRVPANAVDHPTIGANTFGGIHVEQRSSMPPDAARVHHAFTAATVSVEERTAASLPPTPVRRAVEILYKPEPGYTPAARERGVEGEVWLAVVFGRDAKLTVQRVVRGLGFGLDESAIASARAVRFRPAERNGVPVDLEAVLSVRFSLAR